MILDVFGICQQDADGQRLFLECDGEFKHIEFTQHDGEKFEKNVYFLLHAAAATSTARNS